MHANEVRMPEVVRRRTHFVWLADPEWETLCRQEPEEAEHVTNHPSLVTCRKCQDRITQLWQKFVEPHWKDVVPGMVD